MPAVPARLQIQRDCRSAERTVGNHQKPHPFCAKNAEKTNRPVSKKAVVIGAGFAGLSAAAFMAQAGWQVTVLEKNNTAGGRAQQLKAEGFTFDMGPSWYWMPDVFERFFLQFGKKVS